MTSCHHGHVEHQNNLRQAIDVIRTNPDIRIVEIDFIQLGDEFISSHDYVAENISNGSPLLEWVRKVVIERKKILWIDLKSHVDFMAFCCCDIRFKLDCNALFKTLSGICRILDMRVQDKVWLSCQDLEVREALVRCNRRLKPENKWTIVTDIPFVYSYAVNACQYVLPSIFYNWLQDRVFAELCQYDFNRTRIYANVPIIVCIDKSFFATTERLTKFIEDSTIPLGSTIVLYTFERTEPPILISGYDIIMQYDYLPIARKKPKPSEQQQRVLLTKSKPF